MSEIQIRPATQEDLPAIVQMLIRDSLQNPPPQDYPTKEQIAAFHLIAAHPDNEIIVAIMHGEVIGTLQITFIPGLSHKGTWRAEVEGVRVREELRNRRIGTLMMEWVFRRARERGCSLVQLTTNRARTDAQRFYQRLGFQASHVGMKFHLK